jgi:3-hydroxyacyl-CoA dehydrogenase / 3-hydroxy-2-methylbutyryl-CoA dehydrogenase
MRVTDAVGLVTGGASGLGAGVVRMLVEAGGRAVILDRAGSAGADLARELGDHAAFVACDITDPQQVSAAVEGAAGAFGRLDLLVSSAGISEAARVVARDGTPYPLADFRRGIEVNLIGLFDVLRLSAQVMSRNQPSAEGERGLIVNIASIAGLEGQVGQASYAASKGGVVALTLPLARDLASWGIRVMCICPGVMDTPMLAGTSEQVRQALADVNVFPKRLGQPADIAALVRTFMECTYLNGEVVRVDAGTRLAPR